MFDLRLVNKIAYDVVNEANYLEAVKVIVCISVLAFTGDEVDKILDCLEITGKGSTPCTVREDSNGHFYLDHKVDVIVKSKDEVDDVLLAVIAY